MDLQLEELRDLLEILIRERNNTDDPYDKGMYSSDIDAVRTKIIELEEKL